MVLWWRDSYKGWQWWVLGIIPRDGEAHSDIAVSGIRRALVLSLLRLGERSAVTECGVGHAETTGGESAETWAAHQGQARSSAVTAEPACHGGG